MSAITTLKGANGQLSLYDDHLVIERKGFLAYISHMKCQKTELKYVDIRSFTFQKGFLFVSGFFHFKLQNSNTCNLIKAATDPACIVFRSSENKNAIRIVDYLSDKIEREQK